MVNHKMLQEIIELEKKRIKQQMDEKYVRDQKILEETFNNFKNSVTHLLSEEICNELNLSFESRTMDKSNPIYNKFYAIITIDARRRLELTSSDNHFWWLGIITFHHDKISRGEIKDTSGGYWYESNELRERLLTIYEELTYSVNH